MPEHIILSLLEYLYLLTKSFSFSWIQAHIQMQKICPQINSTEIVIMWWYYFFNTGDLLRFGKRSPE